MKVPSLEILSKELLEEGISNTYEYPGYINIQYRQADITMGIDADEFSVNARYKDGVSIPLEGENTFNVNGRTTSDILPKIKRCLSNAYYSVNAYIDLQQPQSQEVVGELDDVSIMAGEHCLTSFPPPTPLATLERMHSLCMQLEDDISEIRLMGGLEDHEDELNTDIESLTGSIQTIIDQINGEDE